MYISALPEYLSAIANEKTLVVLARFNEIKRERERESMKYPFRMYLHEGFISRQTP